MERIQFEKCGRRFWAILLAIVCISFLTFPSYFDNGSTVDTNTNHVLDILVQNNTDFSQSTPRFAGEQQFISRTNNSNGLMLMYLGLVYGFCIIAASNAVFFFSKVSITKIKYYLIVSFSSLAPPCRLI